jgi:predicted ester cyclase
MGIPATGKQIAIAAVAIDRLAGGKIVEEWTVFDSLGMLQQLGVAPLPRAPSTQKTS